MKSLRIVQRLQQVFLSTERFSLVLLDSLIVSLDPPFNRPSKWMELVRLCSLAQIELSFVPLTEQHRVIIFSFDQLVRIRNYSLGDGSCGSTSTQLCSPTGIHVTYYFDLYVADTNNDRIQLFRNLNSEGITILGGSSNVMTSLSRPTAIITDYDQTLIILDRGNQRIIQYFSNGWRCLIGCDDQTGLPNNELFFPTPLAFDRQGNLFVLDRGNQRIVKYQLERNTCCKSNSSPNELVEGRFLSLYWSDCKCYLGGKCDDIRRRVNRWSNTSRFRHRPTWSHLCRWSHSRKDSRLGTRWTQPSMDISMSVSSDIPIFSSEWMGKFISNTEVNRDESRNGRSRETKVSSSPSSMDGVLVYSSICRTVSTVRSDMNTKCRKSLWTVMEEMNRRSWWLEMDLMDQRHINWENRGESLLIARSICSSLMQEIIEFNDFVREKRMERPSWVKEFLRVFNFNTQAMSSSTDKGISISLITKIIV